MHVSHHDWSIHKLYTWNRACQRRSLGGMVSHFRVYLCLGIFLSPIDLTSAQETPVSFRNDIMPILSRGGCNTGGCHGHRDGKGELKLSLWGENPAEDHKALLKGARRVKKSSPAASWILRKPTLQMEHKGNERFAVDSQEYSLLLRWIAQGAEDDSGGAANLISLEVTPDSAIFSEPQRSLQLRVWATFEDGEQRDVTYWATYSLSNLLAEIDPKGKVTFLKPGETTVLTRYLNKHVSTRITLLPERPEFAWNDPVPFNYIDEHIFTKLRRLRMNPSGLCDDATFVRRAFLDIIGTLPTAAEARSFVADPAKDKRETLVKQLLQRPEYSQFWALKWSDLLRNEEKVLDSTGVEAFHGWMRESFDQGKGIDQFVRELLTARGSTYKNPPANYYRALRNPTDRSEATAQLFLGARLRCAKCHNHPFDRWTQDEYYKFAALFDGIDYKVIENKRRDKFDKNTFVGEQEVQLVPERKFKDPRSKKPPEPGLLGSEAVALNAEQDRFEQLADWITGPSNSLFAMVQANRIWYNLMGRGLVNPVDDFRPTNPASHPGLLQALAKDFADHSYDLRHLILRITTSRTYQLSTEADGTNNEDSENYARASMTRLPAEVLLDAAHSALGQPGKFKQYENIKRALAIPGIKGAFLEKNPHHDDRFLHLFGKPPRLLNSDAERLNEISLAQAFEMTSGETLSTLLKAKGNRLDQLLSGKLSAEEILAELYWTAINRPPTTEEQEVLLQHIADRPGNERRGALEDISWALLNSKEFLFRH